MNSLSQSILFGDEELFHPDRNEKILPGTFLTKLGK